MAVNRIHWYFKTLNEPAHVSCEVTTGVICRSINIYSSQNDINV
jgi:hypothetical protein